MMITLIFSAVIMNLSIGTKEIPSIFGVKLCSIEYWGI